MFGLKDSGFSEAELALFAKWQRVSFTALEQVAAALEAGDTERAVALRIHKVLHAAGAQNYFHVPVALFGDRTAYPGDFGLLGALPTDRALKHGDAVILDVSPIFDGCHVDTSYALRFGAGGVPAVLDEALLALRALILRRVHEGATMRVIAREVDAQIRERGLENCHRKHIGAVLGHRVTLERGSFLRGRRIWGLAVRQAGWFFINSWRSGRGKPQLSPNWNHARQSDCPAPDGLWAIEPHVALDGFGAKFEDLLVVQGGRAYFLDEDLPHHGRWRARGLA
ncbi:MAG: M24 family metallopeptidase [Ramlibacter sp.]